MPNDKDKRGRDGRSKAAAALTIEAELIETGEPAPKPGDMYVVSLMLYKVLKVIRGTYRRRSILVGHKNPDLGSPAFQVGVRHRLHLAREFPRHASILNKYENEARGGGIYFCTAFELVNSS